MWILHPDIAFSPNKNRCIHQVKFIDKYAISFLTAKALCEIRFFSANPISAKVRSNPSGMKIGSYPNPWFTLFLRVMIPRISP